MLILKADQMKIIKDPVHGYVEVPHDFLPLLDSPPVQRLRYVKQLGFSHLVYPGANHTRFEHSLGTMHLAQVLGRRLELSEEEQRLVTAAGLLHDVGHGPYSHATEPFLEECLGRGHQEIRELISEGETGEILEGLGLDTEEVCAVAYGKHRLAGIIHGDLDVDRMDYLQRDAHYTGVPYGTVDAQRLLHSILMTEDGIVLSESGINAAESLLIARTLMRPAVYFHHVSRIGESMVRHATVAHLRAAGSGTLPGMMRMDDAGFFHLLLSSPSEEAREMAERLSRRRLYKRALYVGRDQVNVAALRETTVAEEEKLASEIAEAAGVEPGRVLVDMPPFPSEMSMDVEVRNHDDLVPLEQLSPLIKTLNETRRGQWRMGVYTTPEHRQVVEEAAFELLHVRKPTRQDRLTI